ncbi:hypothetical protein [Alicyclobacillus sp. ALC3]|uniref:hypothetical protein n=1 Tax=Alicyclobacillus sp. ALC3 TaxID=2796143 RepID=UPI002378499A|nr:hypothetical protein [Alicyclobacillus sp. ALC3]WDL99209.1 hypothetical protein JC200_11510 [Alicyclobacillus sp. ALC3]
MTQIRVMVFPGAHNLPLWLMDSVEIKYTKSRDQQIAAIQDGEVDVIHTSPDNLSLPDATGLHPFLSGTVGPLELVTVQNAKAQHVLAVDNPHSGFGRLAYKWLRENRPDLSYEVVAAGGTPQRFEALKIGQATMAVMHPPFTEFCKQAGYIVMGRVDVGYPTLCAACREDMVQSDAIQNYRQAYADVLQQLANTEGSSVARAVLTENLPDMETKLQNEIAEVMRQEVTAAGVDFDPELLSKLNSLPHF